MEIINNICYLTIGDKVKLIESNEGGEIIKVIDKDRAIIDFFEGSLEIGSSQIKPFLSHSIINYETVSYYTEHRRKSNKRSNKIIVQKVANEIDLHAEVLFSNHQFMSPEVIIQQQLSTLISYLDRVQTQGTSPITIIHGKGSGSLRSQVINIIEHHYSQYIVDDTDKGKTIIRH